ncbi:MAG: hypothetical protein ACTSPI_17860 [Candidatus Heimdallarchaeaceae archaeon]
MEKKYYTPEIEEFHVGFEFEVFIDKIDAWIGFTYSQYTFFNEVIEGGWSGKGFTIAEKLPLKKVRVKYLDREDIESLGWEYIPHNNANTDRWHDVHKKGEYEIISGAPDKSIAIRKVEGYTLGIKQVTGMFIGTIKNKSELKKLLKQLGI